MILLRTFGFIVALILLAVIARRFRRRSLRLADAIIMGLLAVALALVAITPSSVDPLLRELGFPPGDARRVIGVLVVSNLLTFVLLLRAFGKADLLEEKLGDHADRVAARWFAQEYGNGSPTAGDKVVVVIPALNEEGALPSVMSLVPSSIEGLPVEVVVVSDGSSDKTEMVARDHGALVVGRDLRRGQGAAVALGYRIALLRKASVVATLDGDGQNDPLELPKLVRPILRGEADVVHGSRVMGSYQRPLFGRAHGVRILAWLTSRMTRTDITDPASGFRAFTSEALEKLEFREHQFHASEVTVAACKLGLRVKEVPCTVRERSSGATKKPSLFRYGYGYTRTLLKTWLS
jgi:hypothetical protein